MATSKPASSSNLAKRLVLTLPDNDSMVSITTSPGDTIVLDFDLALAVFDRTDEDLEIKMDNGAVILLSGYFGPGEQGIPDFEVKGGTVIAGADFLQVVSPKIDLSPAAGEQEDQQQAQDQEQPVLVRSSGIGEYREDTATLVGKVESVPVHQESPKASFWTNAIVEPSVAPIFATGEKVVLPELRDLNVEEPFRGATVSEAGLARGTTPGTGADSQWHAFSLPQGVEVAGDFSGEGMVVSGTYGQFVIRHLGGAEYEYRYALSSEVLKPEGGQNVMADADKISLSITDGFNNGSIQLAVDIVDDSPDLTLADGAGPDWAGAFLYSGYDIRGEFDVNFGADGAGKDGAVQLRISDESGKSVTMDVAFDRPMSVEIGGKQYGTIEFKTDEGVYVFRPLSNMTAKLSLCIGATDGDGDFSESGSIVLDIAPPVVDLDPLGSHPDEWFSEQNLSPGGTAADSSQLTKNILLPDGFAVDLDAGGWVAQGWQENWGGRVVKGYVYTRVNPDPDSHNGTLTCIVSESGQQRLTYTLEQSASHSMQGVDRSDVAYGSVGSIILKDSGDNTYSVDTKFSIYDDQPDVRLFGSGSAQSGIPYSGTWSAVFGADGPAAEDALFIEIRITDRDTGGVFTVSGAVSPGVPFVLDDGKGGSYGTLTLFDGGRFEFVSAPNLEADFAFVLTAEDADGDRVSTSGDFTIKVSKDEPTDLPEYLGDVVFDEAHLVAGGKQGSDGTSPDAEALTMPIEVPGQYSVDTAGWTEIRPGVWTIRGEFGFLTYDTTGDRPGLSYTLETAPLASGEGKNITHDTLQIALKDAAGNTYEVPVKVGIVDDIPQVSTEGRDGNAAVVESGETFTDGQWNVNYGADGPAAKESLILKVVLVGGEEVCLRQVSPGGDPVEVKLGDTVYGLLTLKADGTYSFEAAPNTAGQLNFYLIAQDGDGDAVSSGSFSITVTMPGGPDIPYLGHDKVFHEASFENGTRPDEDLLTQELDIPAGFRIDVTADGWTLQENGSYVQKGAKGYFTCSSDGRTLLYTLTGRVENNGNDAIEHDANRGYDVLTGIKLLNDNNNEFYVNAQIAIQDDAPDLHFANGQSYSVESGKEFTSTVGGYQLRFGADGSAQQADQPLMLSVSLNGKPSELIPITHGGARDVTVAGVHYGTLTLNDDGTFSFKAAPNIGAGEPVRLEFGLTARDSDGDVTSTRDTPVVITISKPDGLPDAFMLGEGVVLSEAFLDGGTSAGSGALTKTVALPEGFTPDLVGWSADGQGNFSRVGTFGTLTWDGRKLSYTLEAAAKHDSDGSDGNLAVDVFSGIRLHDKFGNVYEVKTEIRVADDAPDVYLADGQSFNVESGREFTSGQDGFRLSFGADGAADESSLMLSVAIDGMPADVMTIAVDEPYDIIIDGVAYGILTLRHDGTFSFKASPNLAKNGPAELQFGLIATDADGDVVSTEDEPVRVTITKPGGLPDGFVLGKGAEVSESLLEGGTSEGKGLPACELALPDGIKPCLEGWTQNPDGGYSLRGGFGVLNWDGSRLTYTLERAAGHGEPGSESDSALQDVFSAIRLEDAYGNTYDVPAAITVKDDAPEVWFGNGESYEVESGAEVSSGEGAHRVSFGADGPAAGDSLLLSLSVDGQPAELLSLTLGQELEVTAGGVRYGVLLLSEDGSFSFRAAPNLELEQPVRLELGLIAVDADGDKSSSTGEPVSIIVSSAQGLPDDFVLGKGVEFNEAHLEGGTEAGAGELSKELDLPKGFRPETSGWTELEDGSFVLSAEHGVLRWDGQKLSYTLEKAMAHGAPGSETDSSAMEVFSGIRLVDANGNVHDVKTEVVVLDDSPELDVTRGGDAALGGDGELDFTTSGEIRLSFGADGADDSGELAITLEFSCKGSTSVGQEALSLQVPKDGSEVSFETALGRGSLRYDADGQMLLYEYQAVRGRGDDVERLTFSVFDADQDKGSAEVEIRLQEDVPGLVVDLDEAGLFYGSASEGHGPASASGEVAEAMFAPGTVSIAWDLDSMPELSADANLNGVYDSIIWKQEGNTLYGYADGRIAITVEPGFEDGLFTGEMAVTITRAFQHGRDGVSDEMLTAPFRFEQIDEEGNATHAALAVRIKDDAPFGNTPGGVSREPEITVKEGGQVREDVFLVVDVSGSISAEQMKQQIEAIRFLAETYEDNGIDAVFTLVPFGSSAEVRFDGVSMQTLLENLTVDDEGVAYLRGSILGGTNYTSGLDTARHSLISSMADPERSYRDKTVFFLSDGEDKEDGGRFLDTWGPYLEANPDVTVYALGVGDVFGSDNAQALETLGNVAGNKDNVVQVDDFEQLHDALADLVQPERGNLLKGFSSADSTFVSEVTFGEGEEARAYSMQDTGDASGLKNTGHIDIGNGISVVIYENGDYKVISKNISEDYSTTIALSLVDADGDKYDTGPMRFTVQDHKPWALNIDAVYEPGYAESTLFGSFDSALDSKSEGWLSHHSVWHTWLPEGMPSCPSDGDLDPFINHATMQLTAAQLVVNHAQEHLEGNPLTEILSDLEIPTSLQYVSDLFGYQAAFASKSFSSEGGEIVFNWSFQGCGSGEERDAAFWVLFDEDGGIVDSGRIAMAGDTGEALYTESGVTRVHVPDTSGARDYKLAIGCVNGGETNSSDATLIVGAAVLKEGQYDFAGNVYITPWLQPHDSMRLESVVYEGETYAFDEGQDVLVVAMQTGTFVINRMGDYTFAASVELADVKEQIRYTMVDQDGDRGSAVLAISGDTAQGPRSFSTEHGIEEPVDALSPALAGYADEAGFTDGHEVSAGEPEVTEPALSEAEWLFKGDLFDEGDDSSRLQSVEYCGKTFDLGDGEPLTIVTHDGGRLIVHSDGTYSFMEAEGSDPEMVAEGFVFTFTDHEGELCTGLLELKGDRADSGMNPSGGETVSAAANVFQEAGDISQPSGADAVIRGDDVDDGVRAAAEAATVWGSEGVDIFGWAHETDLIGKEIIMDFSMEEGDRFSFTELLTADQSMEGFFRNNISELSLDADRNVLSFDIDKTGFHREVEVQFDPSLDASFSATKADYLNAAGEAAQSEVLLQFLTNISQ